MGIKKQDHEESVVDFAAVRAKKLEAKRRKTERVFFKNALGVYSVVNAKKSIEIEIVDVSEDGIAFEVIRSTSSPWPESTDQVLPIRLYFTSDTFLEVLVTVQNAQPVISNGKSGLRLGCRLDTTHYGYPAFLAFVRFIKLFSENSRKDRGGVSSFYL